MTETRRITDLRDNYEEIINAAWESGEPIILDGENGKDIILMDIESFEDKLYNYKISCELYEAEIKNEMNGRKGYSPEEAMTMVMKATEGK